MVDWRDWPKEKPKIVVTRSLPAWAFSPSRREENRHDRKALLPYTAASVVLGLALIGLFTLFSPREGLGTAVAGLSTLGIIAGAACELDRRKAARKSRLTSERSMELVGARIGDEAVGVAYAEGLYRHALIGDSWDWGAFRLDFDRLSFVGRETRFDLRPEQIRGVEVRRSDHECGPVARIYLHWSDGGKDETLSIELPYVRSRRQRMEAVEALRDRIERWWREPLRVTDRTPLVAPPRRNTIRVVENPYARISPKAMALSAAILLPLWIFAVGAEALTLRHFLGTKFPNYFASFATPFLMFAWVFLAQRLDRRICPPSIPLTAGPLETIDSEEAASEAETDRSDLRLR